MQMKAKLTVRKELQAVITILIYRWENRVPFPIIPSLPSENKHQYKTKPLTDFFSIQDYKCFTRVIWPISRFCYAIQS